MEDRELEVAGARVAYTTAGQGPPLLLLHGDGESRRGWQAVVPQLAQRWRVIAPDLPGYGDSASISDASSERFATWVGELLDALDVEAAPIVGNSLGGLLAIDVALGAPERVRALVLVDAAGLGALINPVLGAMALPGIGELNVAAASAPFTSLARSEARRMLLFAHPSRAPRWWRQEMRRLSRPGTVATSVAIRRATSAPWGQRRIVLERLREVRVPTLVVWGQQDLIVPASHGRAALERLPDGRLAVIPECGHLPHVERPEAFLAEVEPFLASLAVPAS